MQYDVMFKGMIIGMLSVGAAILSAQWPQAPSVYQPPAEYPQSQYPQSQYPGDPAQQSSSSTAASVDPADLQHGVARISIAQGDVNIRRGDNGQYSGAIPNAPVVAHDQVQTSPGSRAELQLDAATLIRLGPDTDLTFADLQYHRAQVQLGLGTIIFRVLPNAATQVEIDTPSIGIRALGAGEYRISVFDNGTSQISTRIGQLEIVGPRGSERLDAGRSVMVRGDASNPELQNVAEAPRDQFDEWSAGLPSEAAAAQSYQYVSGDVQGSADLDRYGNWIPSGYGEVWHPQGVSADWSPYSNGQWSYVDYYGWSWIDYAPWGWAPYHYGRWFNNPGYGWCWWPGARHSAAYWSPAYVGFFGVGSGLGWVSLAPYEAFHPWWGRGGYGFGNRGGFAISAYRNAAFRGGALYGNYNSFGVQRQRFYPATRSQLAGASVISGRLPLSASRASFSYSDRSVNPNSRFATVQNRGFFHANAPGRPFAAAPSAAYRSPSTSARGGWQSFGSPGASLPHQNFQSSESSGWHNFGQPQANRYQSTPRASAPAYQQQQTPHFNAQPSYQAPRYSAPHYGGAQMTPRQSFSEPPRQQQAQPHNSVPAQHGSGSGGGGNSRGGGGGGGGHHGGR